MEVSLLTSTPRPEKIIATAIGNCHWEGTMAALVVQMSITKSAADRARLIHKTIKLGHMSVLEHANFTFCIEGISRACSHQLVRHRLASFAQQSQRHVSFSLHEGVFNHQVPDSVKKVGMESVFAGAVHLIQKVYNRLVENGVPAEDARYLLPNACHTNIVLTMNARELYHFFSLRLCGGAQWEIRTLAFEMLKCVREVAPNIFAKGLVGPSCITDGKCCQPRPCGRLRAEETEPGLPSRSYVPAESMI